MTKHTPKIADIDTVVESTVDDTLTAEAAVKAVKAGHAKDVDIAAQIIAENVDHAGDAWTQVEDKKLMRKVDWRLIPIVSGF